MITHSVFRAAARKQILNPCLSHPKVIDIYLGNNGWQLTKLRVSTGHLKKGLFFCAAIIKEQREREIKALMVLMGISIIYGLSFQTFTSNESRNILIIPPFSHPMKNVK